MSEKTKKIILAILFVVIGIMELKILSTMEKDMFSVSEAISMELVVSIFVSVFVFLPLSSAVNDDPKNTKKTFLALFIAGAIFLIFCDVFISATVAMLDFFFVFIGTFIITPVFLVIAGKKNLVNNILNPTTPIKEEKKCPKCGKDLNENANFCKFCGEKIIVGTLPLTESTTQEVKDYVKITDFDPMYLLNDDALLESFIKKSLEKAKLNQTTKLLPKNLLQRKTKLYAILCVLIFAYLSMIFFHFPILTYIIGAIIILVLVLITRKYNITKYLKKEIKARSSEKISNIIMSAKESLVADNTKKLITIGLVIAIVTPLIIFRNPRILYEKMDNGYGVRFYTFGLTNYKTAKIPATYKGQPVISLRGNTFSNMPFLTKVTLPDTITEIRGQAFKNDKNLKEVNIPNKLKYLGGGAFYNCSSITSVILPDTLTTMGGEVFKNATSLEKIKLSNNLTEIRGSSFENCVSLKEVVIPDRVIRIGGHAFYGNTSLSTITLTENSQLNEIGSSAFRKCRKLYFIMIPENTYVNERAFKESPTSVRRIGYGRRNKFIYVSQEDSPTAIETIDYGTINIKVNEIIYNNYYDWNVNISITGGLNETITFNQDNKEKLIVKNFNIRISSCNETMVGIDISYNQE